MSDSSERTHEPTERHRQKARERGVVAKSNEIPGALVLLAFAVLATTMSGMLTGSMMQSVRNGIGAAGDIDFSPNEILEHVGVTVLPVVSGWAPVMLLAALVGLAANLLQTGLMWTWHPLKPDLKRIDPMSGAQRLFSSRAMVEMVKALAKTALIAYIAWSTLQSHAAGLAQTGLMPITQGFSLSGGVIYTIAIRVSMVWLVLAAVDYFYQRHMTNKQLRMTADEIKRENKEMNMPETVRHKMRQRQQQMARRRMLQDVRKADVVVTNPIQFAVALRYDQATMAAPTVLAKGRRLIAQKIREEAARHNIPIVPNPPLARELYATVEIGEEVPQKLYLAVAQLIRYVYELRERRVRRD